ncbi:tyrosyl-tRNA synthetase [Cryptosporidium ryanae]|uniref:tyrosyl-tRNA synthetase n=1 Tax=Cryptosporidium ryanae TaxID=515981 RepID=UPI00351A5483|nr:tyrosyl-tRNA synthetase [Cryptosporidium ryanae]
MTVLVRYTNGDVVGEIFTVLSNYLLREKVDLKTEQIQDEQAGRKVLLFRDAGESGQGSKAEENMSTTDILMHLGSLGKLLLGKDCCYEKEIREFLLRLEGLDYEPFKDLNFIKELDESLKDRYFMIGRSITLVDIVFYPTLFSHFSSLTDKEESYVPEYTNISKFYENIQIITPIRQSCSENLKYLDLPFFKRKLVSKERTKPSPGNNSDEKRPIDDPTRVALKVGRILSVERHPSADKLYVEKIDLGEDEPRTILSGLVGVYDLTRKINELVIVVSNLKPRPMRGIVSNGMLLCATSSNSEKDNGNDGAKPLCEPVSVPKDAQVGELVYFNDYKGEPDLVLSTKTGKDPFAAVQPFYNIDDNYICRYKEAQMFTSAGPLYVENRSIVNPKLS